ncbi:MAG: molybdenum cofactor guanylyltransferase [Bacteroidales bacterium]|nr:molybdenum cofactor guanylyltransferase [Bacteroidales bacterium]MCF8338112.1 molybdenum cofactor guanylyltransferase [Bacteroidales bacterium]
MTITEPVTGIILAGGLSSRFGKDKSLAEFRGKTFIQHNIDLLLQFTSNILISSNTTYHKKTGYPVIYDKIKNIGPMGGLLSTLQHSQTKWNIILSIDLPLMNEHYLRYLADNRNDALVTIGKDSQGNIHPLCGFYSIETLPYLQANIVKKRYSMKELFKTLPKVNIVAPPGNAFFYSDTIFKNINTLREYYQLLNEGNEFTDLN